MNSFSGLERRVLQMLLEGSHALLPLLRQQIEQSEVKSREMTGVGFFTHVSIPEELRIYGSPSFELSDVSGSASNVRHCFGFVLFIRKGVVSMLEGFTYDDPWPDELQDVELTYVKWPRDLSGLPLPRPN